MVAQFVWALLLFSVLDCRCDYPFRNVSLPWEVRVNDLVSRLTLDEIVPQMAKTQPAPAIDRFDIKPYDWDTECLRGDVHAGVATSFPQSLGLAASFNPSLVYTIAEVSSVEVRAKHNNYTKAGIYGKHTGLSCFSPVINIMRHPLWGRNQETYGEDPFMNGLYAQHFVAGLQGDHPRYVRASAGCKHFDAHGGPDNIPVQRSSFNAKVTDRDWRLTFLPAFRMCVEAGTFSLMCSYNSLNGIPACANSKLLTDVLRGEWGFSGYVVSDGSAVENVARAHHYTNTSVQTVAVCVNAGCNLELETHQDNDSYMQMAEAVSEGMLTTEKVVESVKPLFYTRMRLGEFDPPEMNPFTKIDLSVIESPLHVAISRDAAVQTIVLLKNINNFLPLKGNGDIKTIAVVGPMSNDGRQLFGDYAAASPSKYIITPYAALKSLSPDTRQANGCSSPFCTDYKPADMAVISGSQLVIVCLGTGSDIESEANDRADMNLPGQQLQLLQDAVKYANGTPVILVLFNAGPLDITWADENPDVTSILECFFPAQEAGAALLQVVQGVASPAGRLPFTWYRAVNQTPGITNYTMSERTYRYFTGDPLYPFGYGLSYTNFTYTDISLGSSTILAGQEQTVAVTLHNSGKVVSDEVVQVYISWSNASTPMPKLQLVAFNRIEKLSPNEVDVKLALEFTIQAHQMAQWDDTSGQFFIEPGEIMVYAGGQQPDQRKSVGSNVLQTSFVIKGQKYLGSF